MVKESATFFAAFPAIQTAIKIHGNGEGMRIQLDIPESEMGEAARLLLWRQRVLRVRIEPEQKQDDTTIGRETAKKRILPGDSGL